MADRWLGSALLAVLGLAVAASGDVIILQNGDRIEGEIISETTSEVMIKRVYKAGIKYTDRIERGLIARIEKGPSEATGSAQTAPSQAQPTQPAELTDAERKELLATALAHWEKKDYAGAGATLSRLINGSMKTDLNRMSKEVEERVQVSLGDMAAEAHLQAAIIRSRGSSVTLSYITDYERPYLVPRLISAYQEALKKPIRVEPPTRPAQKSKTKSTKLKPGEAEPPPDPAPPASQPEAPTFELAKLLDAPAGPFNGTREEAAAISRQIRFASSLLAARMRYDGAYKTNPAVRDEIKKEQERLAALQKDLFGKPTESKQNREPRESRTPAEGGVDGHSQGRHGGPGHEGPGDGDPATQKLRKRIEQIGRTGEEEALNLLDNQNERE